MATSEEKEGGVVPDGVNLPGGIYSGFVSENASYFAQTFAALNGVFGNPGPMKLMSEEEDFTVAVVVRGTEEEGVMDVDCALMEAGQESLRDCFDALDELD